MVAPRGEETGKDLVVGVPTTFTIKGSCRLAIWCRIDGIKQKLLRTESFVMCSSITCVIDMPSILWILRWKNTSNFLSSVSRRGVISGPSIIMTPALLRPCVPGGLSFTPW